MRRMRWLVWVVWLVVGIVARTAQAAPAADLQTVEARRLFQEGMAHFNLREYKQAVEQFQAAYRLRPDPVFLFNVAQAYRLAQDPDQALYFYQAYLRTSENPPNRGEVQERIAALEKEIAARKAQPTGAAAVTAPAVESPKLVVAASVPPARPQPVYKRWWLWTIVGVVVAGAAVGVGVGVGTQKSASFNANLGTVGPAAQTLVRF
jgi:tetratricopeptide (TPR) repeat protein